MPHCDAMNMPGRLRRVSALAACLIITTHALPVVADTPNATEPDTPTVVPLERAHAHNDYEHTRPLLDALDQGFCSVEADVFLVKGELWVAHDLINLRADRTLEGLYLKPLLARTQQNGGRVYANGPPVTLLIDFKSSADATYDALLPLLEKYRELFKRGGPIQAIISGNRPFHKVSSNPDRLAYIDGRLGDLDQPGTADWMPLISDRWGAHFKWNDEGDLPIDERQKIVTLVEKAHSQGRRVRFWAIPDKPQAWRTLHALGVDLINTDHLAELADELQKLGN